MSGKPVATKVSISLPLELLEFVEDYRESHNALSRSEVFALALKLLREKELAKAYAEASKEWDDSEDAKLWDSTVGDGL
jgi:Arc/MetJ-type ribon-helix-helix transcriptional regulator